MTYRNVKISNVKIVCKMEETLGLIKEILIKKITVHIYSSPNFSLEIFIGVMICLMYTVLQTEVGHSRFRKTGRRRLKPALSGMFTAVNSMSKFKKKRSLEISPIVPMVCFTTKI